MTHKGRGKPERCAPGCPTVGSVAPSAVSSTATLVAFPLAICPTAFHRVHDALALPPPIECHLEGHGDRLTLMPKRPLTR